MCEVGQYPLATAVFTGSVSRQYLSSNIHSVVVGYVRTYIETSSNSNLSVRFASISQTLKKKCHPFRKDFVDVYIALKGE